MRTFPPRSVASTVPLGSRRAWSWAISIAASGVVATAALAQQDLAEAAPVSRVATRIETAATPRPVATAYTPPRVTAPSAATPPVIRPDLIAIDAPANGTVQVVYVQLGDRVEAGQPLVTFDDRQVTGLVSGLRLEIASAKQHAAELQRTVASLDAEIANGVAQLPPPPTTAPPPEAAAAVVMAQAVYNEAVARERRAAALQAHGLPAAQELEAAQIAVRVAAESLALARREAEAKSAFAAAQMLDARAQAEAAVAAQRAQRAQLVAELDATRQKQREAEAALAEASSENPHLILRAPAPSVVRELAVQAGDRAVAGTSLLKLEPTESRIPLAHQSSESEGGNPESRP